jgi:hypothetical protein
MLFGFCLVFGPSQVRKMTCLRQKRGWAGCWREGWGVASPEHQGSKDPNLEFLNGEHNILNGLKPPSFQGAPLTLMPWVQCVCLWYPGPDSVLHATAESSIWWLLLPFLCSPSAYSPVPMDSRLLAIVSLSSKTSATLPSFENALCWMETTLHMESGNLGSRLCDFLVTSLISLAYNFLI